MWRGKTIVIKGPKDPKVSKVSKVLKDTKGVSPSPLRFSCSKVLKDTKGTKDTKDSIVPEQLIRPSGNYRKLLTYQKTKVIYEMTYFFCTHFLQKGDRTVDQMVQAARSGKQNIIEGCAASATSSKTEIKLINVAKASLQELLEDYQDYLATRGHRQWEEGSAEWSAMRELGKQHNDPEFFLHSARRDHRRQSPT